MRCPADSEPCGWRCESRARCKRKTKPVSEHAEQKAVIEWWAYVHGHWNLPEFALYAVPNGGARHAAVAGKLKAEGVRKGIPDLHLAIPRGMCHGLYVEMKSAEGSLSAEQKDVSAFLLTSGYAWACAHSAEAAMRVISEYLALPAPAG